ncbi:MAG: type II secretion system protein [Bacteroidales bacterium]|jgi:type IV pilus assembly protein PilA
MAARVERNQNGFTLVESIVILLILGVSAAFSIPAMRGFINAAKGKAYIAEAREIYLAAQVVTVEFCAVNSMADGDSMTGKSKESSSDQELNDLSTSLSSAKIAKCMNTRSAVAYSEAIVDDLLWASDRMLAYLSDDIEISDVNLSANSSVRPSDGEAAWVISVGAGATSLDGTGKATCLTYYKDGYQVVISDEKVQVSEW